MLPGLVNDALTVKRAAPTVDAEGNAVGVLATVLTSRGTWGSPSNVDLELAGQRGERVEAVVAMAYADVRDGDVMTVRGADWTVVFVMDVRVHQRVGLRRVA